MPKNFTVVALAGLPGAGKTTIANVLGQTQHIQVLSRDNIKRVLFGQFDFGILQNSIAFDVLCKSVPVLAQYVKVLVIDGMTFGVDHQMERLELVVASSNGIVIPVMVEIDVEVAKKRLKVIDPKSPADRTPELVQQVAESFRSVPDTWHLINGVDSP